jgi:hypothetical protein
MGSDNSTRGDKPQVTDWAGEGTEGGTPTLSKWDRGYFVLIASIFFIKVEGNEGGLYTHLSHTTI